MEENKKKRHSILKKRQSTGYDSSPTQTFSKLPKKIYFSEKKAVKEFTTCEDKRMTIWGDSYEESEKIHSTHSSDASGKSNMEITNFSSTSISRVSNTEMKTFSEQDKENINFTEISMDITKNARISDTRNSSEGSISKSIIDMTVAVDASDKKRITEIRRDINVPVDMSVTENLGKRVTDIQQEEKLVLSPRKTIFYHPESNMKITVQDKVLMRPSEVADEKVQVSDMSLSLQDDEKPVLKSKTGTADITITQLQQLALEDANKIKSFEAFNMDLSGTENTKNRQTLVQPMNMSLDKEDGTAGFGSPVSNKNMENPHHEKVIFSASKQPQSQLSFDMFSFNNENPQKKRVFDDKDMSLSEMFISYTTDAVHTNQNIRKTLHVEEKMEEFFQPFKKILDLNPNRRTQFELDMTFDENTADISQKSKTSKEIVKKGPRATMLLHENMDKSEVTPEPLGKMDFGKVEMECVTTSKMDQKPIDMMKRKTVYNEDKMEESIAVPPKLPELDVTKPTRKTVFDEFNMNDSILEGNIEKVAVGSNKQETTEPNVRRKTVLEDFNMDESISNDSPVNVPAAGRKTIYDNEQMDESVKSDGYRNISMGPMRFGKLINSLSKSVGDNSMNKSIATVRDPKEIFANKSQNNFEKSLISKSTQESQKFALNINFEDMDFDTPVHSPDLKKHKFSESIQKVNNKSINYADLLLSKSVGRKTDFGTKEMDVSDITDTSRHFSRKVSLSAPYQNQSTSQLLTPLRDSARKKLLINNCLDATEKFFSENLLESSMQQMSAKKESVSRVLYGGPRKTLYQEADMSVVTTENATLQKVVKSQQSERKDTRKTAYGLDVSMNVTKTDPNLLKQLKNPLKNIFDSADDMEAPSNLKQRKTIWSNNAMDETRHDHAVDLQPPSTEQQIDRKRQTIFATEDMNETGNYAVSAIQSEKENLPSQNKRQTVFTTEDMDESRHQPIGNLQELPSNQNLEESKVVPAFSKIQKRHTVFTTEDMEETQHNVKPTAPTSSAIDKRQTVFATEDMNETGNYAVSAIQSEKENLPSQNKRQTVFTTEDMDETRHEPIGNLQELPSNQKLEESKVVPAFSKIQKRHTVFTTEDMEETVTNSNQVIQKKNELQSVQSRKTIYGSNENMNLESSITENSKDADKMELSIEATIDKINSKSSRKTVYRNDSMNFTKTDVFPDQEIYEEAQMIKLRTDMSSKTTYEMDESMNVTNENVKNAPTENAMNVGDIEKSLTERKLSVAEKPIVDAITTPPNMVPRKSFLRQVIAATNEKEKDNIVVPSQESVFSQETKFAESVFSQEERYNPNVSFKLPSSQDNNVMSQKPGIFCDIIENGNVRKTILSQSGFMDVTGIEKEIDDDAVFLSQKEVTLHITQPMDHENQSADPTEQSSVQVSVIKEVPKVENEETCYFDIGKLGKKARNSMLLKRSKNVELDDSDLDGAIKFNVTEIPDNPYYHEKSVYANQYQVSQYAESTLKPTEKSTSMSMSSKHEHSSMRLQEMQKSIQQSIRKTIFEQKTSMSQKTFGFAKDHHDAMEGFAEMEESLEDVECNSPKGKKAKFRPSNMYNEVDVKLTQSFHRGDENERELSENKVVMADKRRTFVVQSQEDKRRTFVVEPKIERITSTCSSEAEIITISDSDSSAVSAKPESMLDNESNPCVHEDMEHTDHEDNHPNKSEYFKNYINITLTNLLSPASNNSAIAASLNSSIASPMSIGENYMKKFDDLCHNIKEKRRSGHNIKLDQFENYLKQMKVPTKKINNQIWDPASIKSYMQRKRNEAEYNVMRKMRDEEAREQNLAKQYPESPSAKFLNDNWLECLPEQIEKELEEKSACIPPIFPETKDFVYLLENKISSEYPNWHLQTVYAPWALLKLFHKHMNYFTINIYIDKETDTYSSTIPIYFQRCEIVDSFWGLGSKTAKDMFLSSQFKKNFPSDNLITICNSSKQLFTLMEQYQELIIKTRSIMDNFNKIIVKYDAALFQEDMSNMMIVKKHFLKSYHDIVDVRIYLPTLIDNIDHQYVEIKSLTNYTYQVKPFNAKGLVLIETVLWDVERFLHDHTTHQQIIN